MKLPKDKLHEETIIHRIKEGRADKQDKRIYFTYRELLAFLNGLTKEQLDQQVQTIPAHSGSSPKPITLEPAIGAGTVKDLLHVDGECSYEIHSSVDWGHNPEEIVLIMDGHGFGEYGDTYYEMNEDENGDIIFVGNISGKAKPTFRRPYEPTTNMGKSPAFQVEYYPEKSSSELFERLKQLCKEGSTGPEVEAIQAELYRRNYRLRKDD